MCGANVFLRAFDMENILYSVCFMLTNFCIDRSRPRPVVSRQYHAVEMAFSTLFYESINRAFPHKFFCPTVVEDIGYPGGKRFLCKSGYPWGKHLYE